MSSSIWQEKPWWCQPWTILLTGFSVIGGSWFIFGKIWLTSSVSLLILLWWVYFLIIVPYGMKKS